MTGMGRWVALVGGLLLVALVGCKSDNAKADTEEKPAQVAAAETSACGGCGENLVSNVEECPSCGMPQAMEGPKAEAAGARGEDTLAGKRCPNCKKTYSDTSITECYACETELEYAGGRRPKGKKVMDGRQCGSCGKIYRDKTVEQCYSCEMPLD